MSANVHAFRKGLDLLANVIRGFRRARERGMPLGTMVSRTFLYLRMGPRAFVRQLRHYVSPERRALDVPQAPAPAQAPAAVDPYLAWLAANDRRPTGVPRAPEAGRVSVVMPVCNTPEAFLREVYDSVRAQTHADWELCIHDDASDLPVVRALLQEWSRDPRVRVSWGAQRSGISQATNAALQLATGRWVAFLDHDDLLHPEALAECVAHLVAQQAALVYTDHDMMNTDGVRCGPYFKPDWNPDLFLSQMYLGHLVVIERALVQSVGGLRSECDGAQDYDLALRCIAAGARVAHVPRVLYHWRMHAGSTAANAGSKPYAHEAGRRAIQHYLDRVHPGARAEEGPWLFCYDVRYPVPQPQPLASIVIPTRDRLDLLEVCVRTLLERTAHERFELLIVDNGSVEPATLAWLQEAARDPRVRVLPADVPFNWSNLNNRAAAEARGDVLVFLNNDTEVVDPGWLGRLCENALRPEVGTCGPLLLYGDQTIQHAGVVVGLGGWADHVFKGMAPVHHQQLFASPMMRRDVLALTGACLAIETAKFRRLGGFDESFVICGSDVEICLRAHAAGLRNVYLPEARLVHHESKTRDPAAIPPGDFVRSAEAYGRFRTEGDPFYNPNLDPMSNVPALRPVAA